MIIIILIVLLIIIGLIVFYVVKNRQNNSIIPSILPDKLKDGNFLYNPSTLKLYYNYDTDKFLDAGSCNNCISACQNGIEIQDINIAINCSDLQNSSQCTGSTGWILQTIYTADEYEALIQQKVSGTKELTTNQCISLVNANTPPATGTGANAPLTPADETSLDLMSDLLKNTYTSLTDFITKNKEQFEMLLLQGGMAWAISQFSHSFASAAFIIPMFLQGQYFQATVFTVFEISKVLTRYALEKATQYIAEQGVELSAADLTLEQTVNEVSGEIVVLASDEIVTSATASLVAKSIQVMAESLGKLFNVIGFFQAVGMVLDMIDPCGFNETLYQSDIDNISTAYDNAFYNGILAQTGYIPVIFSADMVKEYGFTCDTSAKTKNSVSKIINKLTTDDPCSGYMKFLSTAKNNYLNAIINGTNSYGQCVGNLKDQEMANFLNTLLGLSPGDKNFVTIQTIMDAKALYTDKKTLKSFFTRLFDTIDISLADNNVIVALYLQKYWYIVFSLILIIILIVFLLK